MKNKNIAMTSSISAVVLIAVFLLANLISHPECGTSGIDYLPCGYWPRVLWSLQNGFWMPFAIIFMVVTAVIFLLQRLNNNGRTSS